jgi:hypothetical protein
MNIFGGEDIILSSTYAMWRNDSRRRSTKTKNSNYARKYMTLKNTSLVLWFEYEICLPTHTHPCVDCLVPSWWCYFGEVIETSGGCAGLKEVPRAWCCRFYLVLSSFLTLWFLSTTRWLAKDYRLKIYEPKQIFPPVSCSFRYFWSLLQQE